MEKFFDKKTVIILIVATIATIIGAAIVGVNLSNTQKTKEKLAKKAVIERNIDGKKEIAERIKKDESRYDAPSEEESYSEEYKKYLELSEEEKSKQEVIPRENEIDYSELENIKEEQEENLGKEYVLEEDKHDNKDNQEVLPVYFNLNDKINVKVENQKQFGLCWDFASLKSVETNLALTQGKDYDLSESHLDYMMSNIYGLQGRKANNGGNFSDMKLYNSQFKGFALEEEIPLNVYEDYEYNTFYNVPKEDLYITKYAEFPAVRKDDDMSQEEYENKLKEFQTVVKTHIMNYGSIYAVIYAPYKTNHYIDRNGSEFVFSTHAISIVGWDDTYSRENFESPYGVIPQKDGAYIALNSWGENWGDRGFFYISYEDIMVNKGMSGVVSINNKSDLLKISDLGKDARKYAKEKYADSIVVIDGEEYLKYELIGSSFELTNTKIKNLKEYEIFLKKANYINLSNDSLDSIDGIEQYIGKGSLTINLSNNNIKDVSCLNGIKINSLFLDNNYGITGYEKLSVESKVSMANCGIKSIDNLEKMNIISTLDLSGNYIEDYSYLTNFTNLRDLSLKRCGLKSIEPLKDVIIMNCLESIDLSYNDLKDISGLENSTIYSVDLSYNTEIEDFEPLRKVKGIFIVGLQGCNIKDAKDVMIEYLTVENIEELYEYDEGYEDEYKGIEYILSDNKHITNVGALKNASILIMDGCEFENVSELQELRFVKILDLSHSHNLNGNLSGKKYNRLSLIDCNLNNDFDLFGIESVFDLDICKNNITNIDNFKDRVQGRIYMDSYDGDTDFEDGPYICVKDKENKKDNIIEIDIPDAANAKVNVLKCIACIAENPCYIKVNGKAFEFCNPVVPVSEKTKITFYTYRAGNYTIRFKTNKKLKSNGIEVVYNPYMNRLKNEEIEARNMKVVNTYENGIIVDTTEFTLSSEINCLPARYEERQYSAGSKSYIYVEAKFYAYVVQDENVAKYTVAKNAKIKDVIELYDEDLDVPAGFVEEFPGMASSEEYAITPKKSIKDFSKRRY